MQSSEVLSPLDSCHFIHPYPTLSRFLVTPSALSPLSFWLPLAPITLPPIPLSPLPCSSIVPVGFLFAGTLWTGNAAYLYLSVSFIQMLKVGGKGQSACGLHISGLAFAMVRCGNTGPHTDHVHHLLPSACTLTGPSTLPPNSSRYRHSRCSDGVPYSDPFLSSSDPWALCIHAPPHFMRPCSALNA